jgi:hypothetical protein
MHVLWLELFALQGFVTGALEPWSRHKVPPINARCPSLVRFHLGHRVISSAQLSSARAMLSYSSCPLPLRISFAKTDRDEEPTLHFEAYARRDESSTGQPRTVTLGICSTSIYTVRSRAPPKPLTIEHKILPKSQHPADRPHPRLPPR